MWIFHPKGTINQVHGECDSAPNDLKVTELCCTYMQEGRERSPPEKEYTERRKSERQTEGQV